jgi:tetratricopeptide (TPR) repeat protein
VPDKPLAEYSFKVDMSGGITQPFPFHVEEVTRGDGALSAHMALDNLAPDVRQQTLRDYFAGQYDEVEPKTFAASWDPATGEEKLVMDGLAKHDWKWGYEADRSRVGWNADFARTEGAHRDAPFAVDYPDFVRVRETILLPSGGKGFVAQAPDVERTIAGVEYHRKTKLEGATYSMELTRRAVAREFPAADAPAAQQALRELAKQQALLGVTDNYIATSQERAAWLTTAPTTALEYFRRADARAEKNDLAGARDDFSKAIALDSSYGWAFLRRGNLLWQMGKPEDALPDLQKAVALMPASGPAHSALGRLLGQMERFEEGAAELDRAVLLTPGDSKALMGRARINFQLDRLDAALADGAAAIKQNPAELMAYQARMSVFKRRNEPDKEVAEGQAAVAANPKSDMAHILLAVAYMQMKRPADGMAEFDKAIAIKPTSYAYLTRANNRAPEDSTGRRADIAAALKLDPTDEVAHQMAIALELRAKKYPAAIAAANKALSQWPKDAGALVNRGIAYAQIGRATEAEKDFAAARLAAGSDAVRLNSLCWSKATFNVALDSALADCDASLRVAPNFPNTLDSRAFVLFRMGRYPDALRGYDEVLKLRPKSAASLYVRGLIERRLGKAVEGDADIKAAKAIESGVDQEFADYGVTG